MVGWFFVVLRPAQKFSLTWKFTILPVKGSKKFDAQGL
jgi:hypothetical protein